MNMTTRVASSPLPEVPPVSTVRLLSLARVSYANSISSSGYGSIGVTQTTRVASSSLPEVAPGSSRNPGVCWDAYTVARRLRPQTEPTRGDAPHVRRSHKGPQAGPGALGLNMDMDSLHGVDLGTTSLPPSNKANKRRRSPHA